jgi:hypothetical protein
MKCLHLDPEEVTEELTFQAAFKMIAKVLDGAFADYDSVIGGFKVLHGSDVRASVVWNAGAQTWTVTDLSGESATGFGVDTVSGV